MAAESTAAHQTNAESAETQWDPMDQSKQRCKPKCSKGGRQILKETIKKLEPDRYSREDIKRSVNLTRATPITQTTCSELLFTLQIAHVSISFNAQMIKESRRISL